MGCNLVSALLLTVAVLITTAKPSASQIIHGLTVGGGLCCAPTGNCPVIGRKGTGVFGVPVHLECNINGRYVPVGLSTTKKYGSFNITVPSTMLYSFEHPIIPCMVRVQLPLLHASNCSALSETIGSSLYSGLKPNGVGTVLLLGLVRNATLTGFVKRYG